MCKITLKLKELQRCGWVKLGWKIPDMAIVQNKKWHECIVELYTGLLVECGKKWKIVRKILPNSAGNSAEKSEIVRENAK